MCGIAAAFNAPKAAEQVAAMLHHQNHRGQLCAGMVTSDGKNMYRVAGMGIASEVLTPSKLDQLHGFHAVGHIRYSTVNRDESDPTRENIQPILRNMVALGHNGNLTNAPKLRQQLDPMATSMDSECMLRLFCEAEGSIPERFNKALSQVRGTYTLGILLPDCLIGVRDPSGNRPLFIGQKGSSWFLASETVALRVIRATVVRAVEPGEIVVINHEGIASFRLTECPATPFVPCVFEEIYFLHPVSQGFDRPVAQFRLELGYALAKKLQAEVGSLPVDSVIVPVPDSANFIAKGVSLVLNPAGLYPALVRNHYVGRTFIDADEVLREWKVDQKFTLVEWLVMGKTVVLVDDSIVRFNTLPRLMDTFREAGALAVYVLIACPPILHPCHYGIDTPTYKELAAATMSLPEIQSRLGAKTLLFLSVDELREISGPQRCFACMTGNYPLPK